MVGRKELQSGETGGAIVDGNAGGACGRVCVKKEKVGSFDRFFSFFSQGQKLCRRIRI